jgi:hypothetical protein
MGTDVKTIAWDREKLYQEVWSRPARTVALEYGISDVALTKICRKLDVPKPGVGYWRRRELGYATTQTALPKLKDSKRLVSHIRSPEPTPTISEPTIELKPGSVSVRRHPLVQQTERALAQAGHDQFGRLVGDWQVPRLDLRVTRNGLPRALAFMDKLVKLLEANEMTLSVRDRDDARGTIVTADGERIRITLTEKVRGRRREFTADERREHERWRGLSRRDFAYEYQPTNQFTFEIQNYSDGRRQWTDNKQERVEDYIDSIARGIIVAAADQKRARAERDAERQRHAREERRRLKYQERVSRLKTNLAAWEEAQRIRAYVAVVRQKHESKEGGIATGSAIARFLDWATRYADHLDPSGCPAAEDWLEDETAI